VSGVSLAAMLYVPGSDERKLAKVGQLDVTAFILDLEDAVAPSAKPRARELVAAAVRAAGDRTGPSDGSAIVRWVRVNPGSSGLLADDLDAVVWPGLDGVVLPKASSAADVRAVDALLALLEARRGIAAGSVGLMPTIESVAGLSAVDEIASASDRVVCLGFGAGDFSLELGLEWPPSGGRLSHTLLTAKAQIVLASRLHGLSPPHDGVFPNFRAPGRLRAEAEEARALGFSGKHAIHPDQVPTIREVFETTQAQLDEARAVLDAYEQGVSRGVGGVHIDGRFVDAPVAEQARRVLGPNRPAVREPAGDGGGDGPRSPAAPPTALDGLRVLDLSSLYAAPLIATNLGDFGAEVIKVEHPRGDDARRWGLAKDGVPLWWKSVARNKRVIALDLGTEEDRAVVRRLAAGADVLIENGSSGGTSGPKRYTRITLGS